MYVQALEMQPYQTGNNSLRNRHVPHVIDVVFLYGHVMVTVTAFANWTYVIGLNYTIRSTYFHCGLVFPAKITLVSWLRCNKRKKNQPLPEPEAPARGKIRLLD